MSSSGEPKSRSLTIFLLKSDITEVSQVLQKRDQLIEYPILVNGSHFGDLYVKPSQEKVPAWLSFFEGSLEGEMTRILNSSTAAIFLTKAGNRFFALSFGYGRNLLQPGSWEENFGLKVTLNCINPNKIRSIDRLTFDAISQHGQIQASREAHIGEFGLDIEQDLLRAVTGTPSDPTLGTRLTGKDPLVVNIKISLSELSDLLARVLRESEKHTYRESFPWVEQIHEIRDRSIQNHLNEQLVQQIKSRDFDHIWLAVPELIEWSDIAGFKYSDSGQAEQHDDIHIASFLDSLRDPDDLTIERLKQRYVHVISSQAEVTIFKWPVYRCLYCEMESGNETFLLNNSKWYRVAGDFIQRVNQSVDSLLSESFPLPNYSDDSEGTYNQRVISENPARFTLMHEKSIPYAGGSNKIEFCDLFTDQKELIHVKRYSQSAPLSHLFAQGTVSARVFFEDSEFRRLVNESLPDTHRLQSVAERPRPGEFTVVFAIVSGSQHRLRLPFFSRVNLKNSYRQLTGLGYQVLLTKIQDTRT